MTAAQITTNIDKMIQEQIDAVTNHLIDAGDAMLQDAEQLVPFDTGRTKASLRADIKKDSKGVQVTIHAGKADDIAFFNEYGTTHMAAQPFMRPAFDRTADKALDKIVKTARDITKKYNDLK